MSKVEHATGTWLDGSGRPVSHQALLAELAQRPAVLLGETHTRYDIHRWQLHVAAGLLARRGNIALGFEMFQRRQQAVLDRWVAGELDAETFLKQAEWGSVWRYDAALYLPLFEFCRQFRVPMLALNCERPLVTRVGKEGWDAIPEAERDGLTPAKPASAAYRKYLSQITGAGGGVVDPTSDRFLRAQQTWDRAFACNIARALDRSDPPLVIGIIGKGHLEYRHGTPYQLDDLGIANSAVLVTSDAAVFDVETQAGIADGMFRLDGGEGA